MHEHLVEDIIVLLLIHGEKVDHMLKEDAVEKLVQKEVKQQVENQVAEAINDPEWVIELEHKIKEMEIKLKEQGKVLEKLANEEEF